ncbi:hypothetical protein B0H34DRAFT_798957 [Crassisporium funariophilum]|nr:hypothetical protein B0H34DRAFT_798957 [Crassisporium funariophilum]
MFTPPPSPQPIPSGSKNSGRRPSVDESMEEPRSFLLPSDTKLRTGRRFRWAVILVPLIVMVFTVSAGFAAPPVIQESTATSSPISWHGLISEASKWRVHKRHPLPEPQPPENTDTGSLPSQTTSATNTSPSTSPLPTSDQTVPTIPSSPPALPTPFPQPFDGVFAQNFSSASCQTFFSNMTASAPFRQCRPFSLLSLSSTDFINAQTNLTLMNSIVWGTCNTNVGTDQCSANMAWFASELKIACSDELEALNTMAVEVLMALQAFDVMHDVACLPDPTTNTYCFLNAVRNKNPSDLYYYQLPLNIPLPKKSTPTCSACSKSVMGLYASALKDPIEGPLLTGLKATYEPSAELSVQLCGAGFAQTQIVSGAMSLFNRPPALFTGSVLIFAWIMLAQIS